MVKNVVYSRQAAAREGVPPTGHGFPEPNEYGEAPMNIVIAGGDTPVEEMVASTNRGILVTRLWYIREVDPYQKIMTGMTRDGTFLVEGGKFTRGLRNECRVGFFIVSSSALVVTHTRSSEIRWP